MLSVVFITSSKCMSFGRFFLICGNSARIFSITSTEFAPVCFWITMVAPFTPLTKLSCAFSWIVSLTYAMSLRKIGFPL